VLFDADDNEVRGDGAGGVLGGVRGGDREVLLAYWVAGVLLSSSCPQQLLRLGPFFCSIVQGRGLLGLVMVVGVGVDGSNTPACGCWLGMGGAGCWCPDLEGGEDSAAGALFPHQLDFLRMGAGPCCGAWHGRHLLLLPLPLLL
jgi:hypothetical protein